jgi:cytochrome b6-f complex iron-sulfur subunit
MADQQSNTATGVLGRLGPWPRKAFGNSAIAAEQAYRKRSGLPELTEEEIAALKGGEPMPWERSDGAPAPRAPAAASAPPASVAAPPVPATPSAASPAPAPAPPAAGVSATVAELTAGGRKWSRSSIAAEQARRKRSGLTPLTDAEVAALLGEVAPTAAPAAPAAAPAARPAAAAPVAQAAAARPAPAAVPAGTAVAREGAPTRYVGTPAVGTSKAAAAGGVAATGPENTEVDRRRRRLVWSGVAAFLAAWFLAFFRFFLPRTLFEPSTVFKIGYPTDYGLGVNEKWLQAYRIWVDRTPDRLFVIYARCTHLGCTPDWKAAENKFKCPCHGSGYDSEGINFEGPAPRPMDRAHIELAPDGQIIVDTSHLYSWPKGQPTHFDDPGAYLPV